MQEQILNYKRIISNPQFIFWMNVARVGVLIISGLILWTLISNINEVKILGTDACALCMNKTGAQCWIGSGITEPCPKCEQFKFDFNLSELLAVEP